MNDIRSTCGAEKTDSGFDGVIVKRAKDFKAVARRQYHDLGRPGGKEPDELLRALCKSLQELHGRRMMAQPYTKDRCAEIHGFSIENLITGSCEVKNA
jgi:hypothetical protein